MGKKRPSERLTNKKKVGGIRPSYDPQLIKLKKTPSGRFNRGGKV